MTINFDLYPDSSGADQTAALRALFTDADGCANQSVVLLAPGDYTFRADANSAILNLTNRTGIRLVGENVRIKHAWDPSNPDTLKRFYEGHGGADHSFEGLTYEPSPRVDTQGTVRAVSGNDFTIAVAPLFEPAWTTADNLLRIVEFPDGTYGCDAWKFKVGGASRPFPFVKIAGIDPETGWNLYKGSPTDIVIVPTAATAVAVYGQTNVLQFTMAAGALLGGETLIPSGYTGNLGTAINGNAYTVELPDPNDDNATSFYLVAPGGTYASADLSDGSGASFPGSAFMSIPGLPSWVTLGSKIVVQCRKHGDNAFYARGVKGDLRFDRVRFKGAQAVPLYLWDFDTLYLDVEGRGDGYIAANAGPVNVFNGKLIYGPGIRWMGSGDDVFNPRTRSWQSRIEGWSVAGGWIDVLFNGKKDPSKLNDFGNNPTTPSEGDKIEFAKNTPVGETTLTVKKLEDGTSTELTRVTFNGALPTGFDPQTWRVLNRSTVPVVDLERVFAMASGGRTIVCQSHDMRIRQVVSIGCRFSNIVAPSSLGRGPGQLGDGGFKGGLHIGEYIARHSCLDAEVDDRTEVRAILRVEAKKFDQSTLSGPTGWPQITIDYLDADDFPYTAIYAEGVDVVIGGRSVRNGGTRRPDPNLANGDYDYAAINATIRLDGGNGASYVETKQELAGGKVILNTWNGATLTGTTSVQKFVEGDGSTLTIASDTISVTGSYHKIDTEGGATSDDLSTINGGVDNQILTLRTIVSGRSVRVRSGVAGGNIVLQGGDCTLAGPNFPHLSLIYSANALAWRELARPSRYGGLTVWASDTNASFSVNTSSEEVLVNAPYTASRILTLQSANANAGDRFRFSNVGANASANAPKVRDLTSAGTILYTLLSGRWAEFAYNGSNWLLTSSGLINTP